LVKPKEAGWLTTLFALSLRPMIDESLVEQIVRLEPAERLELIGVVWNSLSADDLPVTEAERVFLDARLADMELNPDDQSSWSEVRNRLERLLP
jgi:putative addiction module component (TIGR02574 family)